MLKKATINELLKHIVVRNIQGKEVRVVDLDTSKRLLGKSSSHNATTNLTWYQTPEATVLHYTSEELWCFWETPCYQEYELHSILNSIRD